MSSTIPDPLRITSSGMSEGVVLTLSEDACGLPRLTQLRVLRSGLALSLIVEGAREMSRVRQLLPRDEAGKIPCPGTMCVTTLEWGPVEIVLDGSEQATPLAKANEPTRLSFHLGVREVRCCRVATVGERWACAVLGGAPETEGVHEFWPSWSTYIDERREAIERGHFPCPLTDPSTHIDDGYEAIEREPIQMDARGGRYPVRDHVVLNLAEYYAGAVLLGSFKGAATTIPRPGFLVFSGHPVPTPNVDIVHGLIRGIGLLFGLAPCMLMWLTRDANGQICSWQMHSGYSPAPLTPSWPVSAFVEQGRPHMIGAKELSRALRAYLSQREAFALDRVSWLASHGRSGPIDRCGAALRAAIETIVKAGTSGISRKIIEKYFFDTLLTDLQSAMDSWRKKSSINSKDMERLYTKLAQINDRSDIANLPALFAAKDIEFGDFEQAAWNFSNKCAHADNPSLIGDEKTLLLFRVLQATVGRIIVGVTGVHDTYIDYSSPEFPSRPVSQTVGGTKPDELRSYLYVKELLK